MSEKSPKPKKLKPTSTHPNDVVKRLVKWIAEQKYLRGHRTGELLRDSLTCINKMRRMPKQVKAPKGCVIDDEGEIIAGAWTHKNGGHGDFHWRFDANEGTEDE